MIGGTPIAGWLIRGSPIQMDDLGVPPPHILSIRIQPSSAIPQYLPSMNYWTWPIDIWSTYYRWFSMAMFVYQRVTQPKKMMYSTFDISCLAGWNSLNLICKLETSSNLDDHLSCCWLFSVCDGCDGTWNVVSSQAAGGETGRARQPKRTRPAWQEAPEWAIGLGWSRCCTPRFEALELLWF